jgi:hypothetical protein
MVGVAHRGTPNHHPTAIPHLFDTLATCFFASNSKSDAKENDRAPFRLSHRHLELVSKPCHATTMALIAWRRDILHG